MKKLKHAIRKRANFRGRKNKTENDAIPRITNETVAAHRDEVLG